jgi:hypothetical protein
MQDSSHSSSLTVSVFFQSVKETVPTRPRTWRPVESSTALHLTPPLYLTQVVWGWICYAPETVCQQLNISRHSWWTVPRELVVFVLVAVLCYLGSSTLTLLLSKWRIFNFIRSTSMACNVDVTAWRSNVHNNFTPPFHTWKKIQSLLENFITCFFTVVTWPYLWARNWHSRNQSHF